MEELKAAQAKLAAQLLQPTSHSPSPPRQRTPPPLPPRKESTTSANAPSQPLKERGRAKTIHEHVQMGDPRSSSMQSLRPRERELESGRRSLLLIFIHGFMGNETSFQSFPAHLHHLLTYSLADSHTVHSKIYPRYKSRRPIEFARDDFSRW